VKEEPREYNRGATVEAERARVVGFDSVRFVFSSGKCCECERGEREWRRRR
jgi:hypothetical protein